MSNYQAIIAHVAAHRVIPGNALPGCNKTTLIVRILRGITTLYGASASYANDENGMRNLSR